MHFDPSNKKYMMDYLDMPAGWVAATETDGKINWLWGVYERRG